MTTLHLPDTLQDATRQAAQTVSRLIDQDDREQKQIAAAAAISPGQLTHLKQGARRLNPGMARRLGRAWPNHAHTLQELAYRIDDLRTQPATLPSTHSGVAQLAQLTAGFRTFLAGALDARTGGPRARLACLPLAP